MADGNRIIGIDPSLTATGICTADGATEVWTTDLRGSERLAWFYRQTIELISIWNPHVICIEGYSFNSRTSRAHALGELGGVIRLACHDALANVLEVPPTVVKKYATGKGNANKDLVRDAARDRLGLPAGVTSDECDASWLRQIGLAVLEDRAAAHVPESHLTALAKLDIPETIA